MPYKQSKETGGEVMGYLGFPACMTVLSEDSEFPSNGLCKEAQGLVWQGARSEAVRVGVLCCKYTHRRVLLETTSRHGNHTRDPRRPQVRGRRGYQIC